jgi:translation initiation factor IF-2
VEADDAELLLLEMGYAVSRGGATTEELLSLLDAEGATKGAGIDAAMAAAASRREAAALAAAGLSHLPRRAPVVCVMGHVDAGKTTLMDALRNDARAFVMNGDGKAGKDAEDDKDAVNEAAGEAGGITQRVAAFHVPTAGRSEGGAGFMTVIDTPGHAAFSGMRASGVCATDVVVVVVAAESGIQPQTEEVLKMARASNCAVVVAVTKLDRLSAIERKKALERAATELLEHGWVVEAMGGEVPLVPCSGKTREGLGDLKDVVALQAELLDLRAASEGAAEATVLEASTLKGHGVVLDCLVSSGLLQVGDYVVVGKEYGKVRKLMDPSDSSAVVQSAGPSMAVRVVGLKGLPQAGSRLAVCRDESTARQLAKLREDQYAMQRLRDTAEHVDDTEHSAISARTGQLSRFAIKKQKIKVMRERALMAKTGQFDFDPGVPRQTVAVAARNSLLATEAALAAARLAVVEEGVPFPVVVKVDSFGSVAAVMELIAGLPDDKVCVQIVHIEVGPVTTGDVELAIAAAEREGVKLKAAPIFAFNVGSNGGDVTTAAKRAKVQIRKHKVIYSLIDDLRELLTAAIPVKVEESIEGRAHVKQVFEIKKKGVGKVVVAGCAVDTGRLLATGSFRVIRNGTVLHSTESGMSLQHHQSEVPEVKHGIECGVGFSSFSGLAAGDVVECFVRKEIKQVL